MILREGVSHSEHSISFIQPTHGAAIFSHVINRSVIFLYVPVTFMPLWIVRNKLIIVFFNKWEKLHVHVLHCVYVAGQFHLHVRLIFI